MSGKYTPLLLGGLTYGAVWYMGGTPMQAGALAAIPVLFGYMQVARFLAYTIASLIIIAGVVWAAMSPGTRVDTQRQIAETLGLQSQSAPATVVAPVP